MSRRGHRFAAIAVGLATASALLAGCSVHGLTLVADKRVQITAPPDHATKRLPVTLVWSAHNIGPGIRFAVLVDRTPPPSGKTLAWLFRGRDDCKGPTGQHICQQPTFLAQQGIHVTAEHDVRISAVESLRGDDAKRSFHTLTIVLVDGDGQRVGEGAWSRDVELNGPAVAPS